MQLVILAAGRGSRLPKKFRDKPKCLVELNSKPLILYNDKFIKKFKKKIIITGYKRNSLSKIITTYNFININNKRFQYTNMVYSLFLARKFIRSDVVVVYGDVIFNDKIFEAIKTKDNILPVNIHWLNNWKNRMPLSKVFNDAENLTIKKNFVSEIGTKIDKKKIPKYQFMGILRLKKKTFIKCYTFFKKLKNNKIDMTSFINLCIKNNIFKLKISEYKDYWYEIDTTLDLKLAEKNIKKW